MADTPAVPGQGDTVPGTQGRNPGSKSPSGAAGTDRGAGAGKTLLGAAEVKPDAQGKTVPEGEDGRTGEGWDP